MSAENHYQRYIKNKVITALSDTPVVVISGPRQCGKTTLASEIKSECNKTPEQDWDYITLDDTAQLLFATQDPIGFIRNLTSRHVVIDEVQRAPEIFLAIKQSVDENRLPGRFLLTGSTNALTIPQLSDALVGRMEIITLMPLAECEITASQPTFLTQILSGHVPKIQETRVRSKLINKIIRGGYPEAVLRNNPTRRNTWHMQYVSTIIQRDLKEIGHIEYLQEMSTFIQALAQQVGCLTNYSKVASDLGISRLTAVRYMRILAQLFIFEELPAWHNNELKRLVKTPKLHIVDSGLLCTLKKITPEKISKSPHILGGLLESYVYSELKRLASWVDEPLTLYHYRDKDKLEVDLIMETLSQELIGIEIKASATISQADFKGLAHLKAITKQKFKMGILLYDGDHIMTHDNNLHAIPIAAIWH